MEVRAAADEVNEVADVDDEGPGITVLDTDGRLEISLTLAIADDTAGIGGTPIANMTKAAKRCSK